MSTKKPNTVATKDDEIFRLCEDFDPSFYEVEPEDISEFKNKLAEDHILSTAPEANIKEVVYYWQTRRASIYKIDTGNGLSEDEEGNKQVVQAPGQEKDGTRAYPQNLPGKQKNKKKKNRKRSQQQCQQKFEDQRLQGEGSSLSAATFTTAPPNNDIQASNSIFECVESIDKEPQSTQRQHLNSVGSQSHTTAIGDSHKGLKVASVAPPELELTNAKSRTPLGVRNTPLSGQVYPASRRPGNGVGVPNETSQEVTHQVEALLNEKEMEIHALLESLERYKNENSHLRKLLKKLEIDRDDDEQRQYGIKEKSYEELAHIKRELHAVKKELWELRKRDSSQGAVLAEAMFNCEKNAADLASARKIIEDLKEQNSTLRVKYDQQASELGKSGQDTLDVTRRLSLTETQLKRMTTQLEEATFLLHGLEAATIENEQLKGQLGELTVKLLELDDRDSDRFSVTSATSPSLSAAQGLSLAQELEAARESMLLLAPELSLTPEQKLDQEPEQEPELEEERHSTERNATSLDGNQSEILESVADSEIANIMDTAFSPMPFSEIIRDKGHSDSGGHDELESEHEHYVFHRAVPEHGSGCNGNGGVSHGEDTEPTPVSYALAHLPELSESQSGSGSTTPNACKDSENRKSDDYLIDCPSHPTRLEYLGLGVVALRDIAEPRGDGASQTIGRRPNNNNGNNSTAGATATGGNGDNTSCPVTYPYEEDEGFLPFTIETEDGETLPSSTFHGPESDVPFSSVPPPRVPDTLPPQLRQFILESRTFLGAQLQGHMRDVRTNYQSFQNQIYSEYDRDMNQLTRFVLNQLQQQEVFNQQAEDQIIEQAQALQDLQRQQQEDKEGCTTLPLLISYIACVLGIVGVVIFLILQLVINQAATPITILDLINRAGFTNIACKSRHVSFFQLSLCMLFYVAHSMTWSSAMSVVVPT